MNAFNIIEQRKWAAEIAVACFVASGAKFSVADLPLEADIILAYVLSGNIQEDITGITFRDDYWAVEPNPENAQS